ncbi:MAG: hypothetical protein A2V67_07395 [Deltaproteobacteria bacterium RBG_13_61_14]|nr:MAG: hypothetical protein A2V67_07395 [Deltaproteobacteria bacterium RBG_13_61_14]
MSSPLTIVRRKVAELRRRIFWIQAGQGLSLLGGTLGLVLLLGGALPWLPAPLGLIARLLLLLALVAVPALFLVRPLLQSKSDDRLALVIESAHPELKNALINAIQLGREQEAPDPRHPFSAVFLDKHLEHAASLAPQVALDRAAPLHRLKQRFLFLAIAALALALAQAVAPKFLARSFSALVLADFSLGTGKSKTSLARTAEPLTAGEFSLRYHYPAYTGRKVQTVEHSNGAITALKGTQVELATEVLEEVREANAVLEPGGKIPLRVEGGHRLSGQLTVMAPGAYYLEAFDRKGRFHAEPRGRPILVEEDLYPEVTLEQPVADLEVSPGDSVEIIYRASDDFGLGAAFLVFRLKDAEQRREIFRADLPTRERRARFPWRVDEDEIQPGETVAFFIEVEDNDNVSGPKASRSQTLSLSVFSPRKRHEQMLARQEELFERMLGHLGDHLDDEIARQRAGANYNLVQAETALLNSGRAVQTDLEKLALDLEEDFLTEDLVRSTLTGMARTFGALLDRREANLAQLPAAAGLQLALREQSLREVENDVIFFDKLIKKQRIDQVLAQSRDLYAAQAELADLLQRYQKSGDPALWEEIRRKMAEVEAAYQALLERMAQMPREMPEEFVNAEALQNLKFKDFASQMAELQKALSAGDAKAAMELANQFLASLNAMMSAMEEGAGGYGDAISAEALRRMGAMQDELTQLEKAEQKLIEQTEALEKQALKRDQTSSQDLTQRLIEKTEQLEQRLAELNDDLLKLRPSPQSPAAKPAAPPQDFYAQRLPLYNQLHALQNELRYRKQELQAQDLEKALQGFRRHEQTLDQAQPMLKDFLQRQKPAPPDQSQALPGQCQAAGDLNREIIRELLSRKQALAKRLSPEEQARLQVLAQDQDQVKDRTQRLLEEFQSLSQEVPGLPSEIEQNLDQGQAYMRDASGELTLEDPGRALVPEREAKQRLSQARQALENAAQEMAKGMKPGMGMPFPMPIGAAGRRGGEGGRRGLFNRDFELPSQNAYQVPRAFRQDILDAMKDGSPEEYKDLNRDYYERLVR